MTDFPGHRLFHRPATGTIRLIPESGARADLADDQRALEWLRSASAEQLAREIALTPPAAAAGAGSSVTPSAAPAGSFSPVPGQPERLRFTRSEQGGTGYLMVPDAWFPGWRAEIDGEPATLHRANVLFKAVLVPASAEVVEFIYEPLSVRLGAVVSAIALLVWLALMVRGRVPVPGILR
jgi:hypothetical protein